MTFLQLARLQQGHRGAAGFSYGGLTVESGFEELRQTLTQQNVHHDHPSKSSTVDWLTLQKCVMNSNKNVTAKTIVF